MDYDVQALISEKPIDINRWNPHKPGFIPDSSLNLTLYRHGDGWLCNGTLTHLSQGTHHITVWIDEELDYISYGYYVGSVFSTVSFTVDSTPPNVAILSPEPQTYNVSDVPLNFTVSKAFTQIAYSLDGSENVTANADNVTLTQLSNGVHSLTVYATDEAGNTGASQTINFTIAKPDVELPETEPFPTTSVAVASGASAVVVAAGLLVYFKKHKR